MQRMVVAGKGAGPDILLQWVISAASRTWSCLRAVGVCPLKSQADWSLMNDINTFNILGITHQHDQNFILLKSKNFYSKSSVSIFISSDLVERVLCKSRPTHFPVRQPRCFLLPARWRSAVLLPAPKEQKTLLFNLGHYQLAHLRHNSAAASRNPGDWTRHRPCLYKADLGQKPHPLKWLFLYV